MNGDDTIPTPTSFPPPPPAGRRAPTSLLRLLEMALFTAVFITGGTLGWLAAFGDERGARALTGSLPPVPAPQDSPSFPEIVPPDFEELPVPAFTDQIQFAGARSEVDPPTGGCTAHIEFIWEIDRGLSPPFSGRALIEVNGPDAAGDYHRPVTGGEIRLILDVALSAHDVFEADVVSVGGVPAFPTPLEASFDTPFC